MTIEELRTIGKFDFPQSMEAFYETQIAAAEKACLDFIGAENGTVAEFFEPGGKTYALTHQPVQSVQSVEVGGRALTSSEYRYESRASKVVLKVTASEEVKVSYSCSFQEDNLFKVCVAMVIRNMDAQRLHAGVKQASFAEGGQETYYDGFLTGPVMTALASYQKGHVL